MCKTAGIMATNYQNLFFRLCIVFAMVAAVVTILYLTPVPDQRFKNCDRPCHELDWPMICRLKLNIEMYQTMAKECQNCPLNSTDCENKNCASADGSPRGIITANRQLPGPPIQVCKGDILVVDVINKIPSHSLTVHWRGQPNHEAPFMDGSPMISQCPIPSYTTFQYKFRASRAGTHFWQAFSDADRSDGLFGALVVREADKIEPHRKLYDIDAKDHVILISEWSRDLTRDYKIDDDTPKTLLINGRYSPEGTSSLASFTVQKGKRYRFRVAYTSGYLGCPITFSIDNHKLKVIALDGAPITPYEVSFATLGKGERMDFVLKTDQEIGAHFLRLASQCKDDLTGLGVINYEGVPKKEFPLKNQVKADDRIRVFDTAICDSEIGKVCLKNVKALNKMPNELREYEVGRKIYLGFDYKLRNKDAHEGGFTNLKSKIYAINNLTFTFPPSPVLTQPDDVPVDMPCNELNIPDKCSKKKFSICECFHVEYIPLGSSTEIILIDQGGDEEEHVFHLHGYHFYVVGKHVFDKSISVDQAKALDAEYKLMKRNFNNPVLKDTIRVPKFGAVALRFIANNPGFWILRDEQSKSWTRGLDIVFQVGHTDEMVSTPKHFPTCGNFIGPDFFLL
ncbi:unnamed protein product [Brassicogethes aeneus]|uniref:Uncharacterized protein n=1 Tax=Brassicogethes aeneus TaxID=1431903 RepID=A0A9P0FGN2_BRAAE|nr:unnamed protein product [Brassicogethes aeneus]